MRPAREAELQAVDVKKRKNYFWEKHLKSLRSLISYKKKSRKKIEEKSFEETISGSFDPQFSRRKVIGRFSESSSTAVTRHFRI